MRQRVQSAESPVMFQYGQQALQFSEREVYRSSGPRFPDASIPTETIVRGERPDEAAPVRRRDITTLRPPLCFPRP